ncbi:S41 family peptidase [Paraflavitalea pollutisoli]|uniref:S41 family peptidase n=1 Tax=Paraflavitalea pollutisoli TaxID=3034143 RepID=UPI0023EE1241|nr:S41 family peptidase [Paraflavitalea sp. H1-2-19X]
MKNGLTLLLLLVFPSLLWAQSGPANRDTLLDRTVTQQQAIDDLRYLRKALEAVHPGLYRYTPKPIMDQRLDSFEQKITGTMPFYDYYRLLTALMAAVRCAHTGIYPGNGWENHFRSKPLMFPFSVQVIKGKMYVAANLTSDTLIKPGYELTVINGQPLPEILHTLYALSWADGYNETVKQERLNRGFFGPSYYMYIARPDSFTVACKDLQGQPVQVTYPAVNVTAGNAAVFSNPVNKEIVRLYVNRKRPDLDLKFEEDLSTAILSIRTFGGKPARDLPKFLEKSMKEIKAKKTKHLIIDLRANPGGSDSAGVLLFTYLISQPARFYLRQHTISDSSEYLAMSDLDAKTIKNVKQELVAEKDGTFSIKPEYAAGLPLQYPKPDHFNGKLYFLMDGGSASTTSELLAAVRANQLGILIGEEAAGAYEGGNAGSFVNLLLPNTKMRATIPLVYYDNATGPVQVKGRGVLPDHELPYNISDILIGVDTQKRFALELVRKGQ